MRNKPIVKILGKEPIWFVMIWHQNILFVIGCFMEYGKLAKAQAIKVYILYNVLVWPVTLEAVKMVINTTVK